MNFTIGESDLTTAPTTEQQEADAVTCLTRHGAMDLAPMLGLA